MYFVTYKTACGVEIIKRFHALDSVFGWLQEYNSTTGGYPPSLSIYKSECLFDLP